MSKQTTSSRADWLRFFHQISPETNSETLHVLGELRRVSHSMYQLGESSLEDAGLSYAQYRVLLLLLFSEEIEQCNALNPSQISRRQGTNRNTVSALLRHLEKDGLVERELDPHDRRKFNIRLSEAGRQLVRAHAHNHFQTMHNVFAVLDAEEVDWFGRILAKLNTQLERST